MAISTKSASVLFMLVAVSLFAMLSLMAKTLGNDSLGMALHPFQITTGRFCFALLLLIPIAVVNQPDFRDVPWRLHIVRGITGWLGISCLFAAAIKIPLADANAISFFSVIITMALSIPMLGERVGIRRWSAALIALAGALILIRPGSEAFHPAALIALLAAGFIGLESILIKQLSGMDRPLRILLINNTIGAAISLIVVYFFWAWPNAVQWMVLGGMGVGMVLIQFCFIQALKRMEASFVTPFWYATPLFAAIYDYLAFDQYLGPASIAGIALITMGGIVICRRS